MGRCPCRARQAEAPSPPVRLLPRQRRAGWASARERALPRPGSEEEQVRDGALERREDVPEVPLEQVGVAGPARRRVQDEEEFHEAEVGRQGGHAGGARKQDRQR